MARYLITGGAGFIGSNLAHALVAQRESVRILDDFSSGRPKNLDGIQDRVEIVRGDLRDPVAVARAVRGDRDRLSPGGPQLESALHQGAGADQRRQRRRDRVALGGRPAGRGATPGVCLVVIGLWRAVAGAPQDGGAAAASQGALRGLQTGRRAVLPCLRPGVRSGDGEPALLQRLRTATASRTPSTPPSFPGSCGGCWRGKPPVIFGDGEQSRDFTPVANVVAANLCAAEATAGDRGGLQRGVRSSEHAQPARRLAQRGARHSSSADLRAVPPGGHPALLRLDPSGRGAAGLPAASRCPGRTAADGRRGSRSTSAETCAGASQGPGSQTGSLLGPFPFSSVTANFDRGGAEKIITRLAVGLPRDKYAVRVAALQERSGAIGVDLTRAGIPVHDLGMRGRGISASLEGLSAC